MDKYRVEFRASFIEDDMWDTLDDVEYGSYEQALAYMQSEQDEDYENGIIAWEYRIVEVEVVEVEVPNTADEVVQRLEAELSLKKNRYRELEANQERYVAEGSDFMDRQMQIALNDLEPEIKLLERILNG